MAPNPRRLDERLQALYDRIPAIACCGACHDSCGPIETSVRERVRIERQAGRALTCGEGASCSMLTPDRRCSVYENRPLICRLWGVVESLPCPYGCKPERYLTNEEGYVLMAEAFEIGGHPSGDRFARELRRALQALARLDPDERRLRADLVARLVTPRPSLDGRRAALPKAVIER